MYQGRLRGLLKKGASASAQCSLVRGVSEVKGQGSRSREMSRVIYRMLVSARAKANGFLTMYDRVGRVTVPSDRIMRARE